MCVSATVFTVFHPPVAGSLDDAACVCACECAWVCLCWHGCGWSTRPLLRALANKSFSKLAPYPHLLHRTTSSPNKNSPLHILVLLAPLPNNALTLKSFFFDRSRHKTVSFILDGYFKAWIFLSMENKMSMYSIVNFANTVWENNL